MDIKVGLLVDFGNSGTRASVLLGGKEYDLGLDELLSSDLDSGEISNNFAALPSAYKIPPEYTNIKNTIFSYNNVYYANGKIVEREFTTAMIRPTSVEAKTSQLVTELTLNLVYIKAIQLLANLYSVTPNELQLTFDVSALLPPLEYDTSKDVLENTIKSMLKVSVLVPQKFDVAFAVDNVKVIPEGVAAYFGACFYEKDNELHEVLDNKEFFEGYVLVVDIGAGTTDIVLIKDGELVVNSKDTFKKGGNTVESYIRNAIKKEYGFVTPSCKDIVATGNLLEGSEVHDVVHILDEGKVKYSTQLLEDVRGYFEGMAIDMRIIKGILVAGGGTLPAKRGNKEVSPAMSKMLYDYIVKLAPKIKLVKTEGKNPRKLNILGLKYIHKYM